jgi:hypothetical protein
MSLHPGGLASRIVNLAEWKAHVLARLRRQVDASGDSTLIEMARELASYPVPPDGAGDPQRNTFDVAPVFVPLILRSPAGVLSFLSTTTIFGTPVDVTLSEIALESFFPADESTAAALAAFTDLKTKNSFQEPTEPNRTA